MSERFHALGWALAGWWRSAACPRRSCIAWWLVASARTSSTRCVCVRVLVRSLLSRGCSRLPPMSSRESHAKAPFNRPAALTRSVRVALLSRLLATAGAGGALPRRSVRLPDVHQSRPTVRPCPTSHPYSLPYPWVVSAPRYPVCGIQSDGEILRRWWHTEGRRVRAGASTASPCASTRCTRCRR
jgi:hypothetical protein